MPESARPASAAAGARQRLTLLHRLERGLDLPMALLSGAWLYLMVVELTSGLDRAGETASIAIWVLFICDFLLRFILAPRKLRYLRTNWLTAVSLLLPALRVFRLARVFRLLSRLRGLQLVRVLGSVNRGMKALGRTMRRRGFGYFAALTLIVTFAGAAGMLHFERGAPGGLDDFWSALWWTAMLVTTMGSEYWPRTAEGRVLCLLLALYAFSAFGYFTGAIATYFVGRDAAEDAGDGDGLRQEVRALRAEIGALREQLQRGERRE